MAISLSPAPTPPHPLPHKTTTLWTHTTPKHNFTTRKSSIRTSWTFRQDHVRSNYMRGKKNNRHTRRGAACGVYVALLISFPLLSTLGSSRSFLNPPQAPPPRPLPFCLAVYRTRKHGKILERSPRQDFSSREYVEKLHVFEVEHEKAYLNYVYYSSRKRERYES